MQLYNLVDHRNVRNQLLRSSSYMERYGILRAVTLITYPDSFPPEVNLTELQKTLDAQGIELVDNQKESLFGRKALAEKTKGTGAWILDLSPFLLPNLCRLQETPGG